MSPVSLVSSAVASVLSDSDLFPSCRFSGTGFWSGPSLTMRKARTCCPTSPAPTLSSSSSMTKKLCCLMKGMCTREYLRSLGFKTDSRLTDRFKRRETQIAFVMSNKHLQIHLTCTNQLFQDEYYKNNIFIYIANTVLYTKNTK